MPVAAAMIEARNKLRKNMRHAYRTRACFAGHTTGHSAKRSRMSFFGEWPCRFCIPSYTIRFGANLNVLVCSPSSLSAIQIRAPFLADQVLQMLPKSSALNATSAVLSSRSEPVKFFRCWRTYGENKIRFAQLQAEIASTQLIEKSHPKVVG